jgi:hypothetical protein
MRKKILYGVMCAALSVSMLGCGSKETNTTSVTDNVVENEVTDSSNNNVSDDTETVQTNADTDISSMDYDAAKEYLASLPETDSSYFEYITEEMDDGECAITYYSGEDSIVVVPEEIDGLKVVRFENYSFTNNEGISAVRLPQTTRIIDKGVFCNCENLLYVTGLENVEYLGKMSFSCLNLRCVEFGDSVTEAEEGTIFRGYNITLKLKEGSYLANIGDNAWYRDSSGVTVELY